MSEDETPTSRYNCLKNEIDGYIKYSYTWMRVGAWVYYSLRTALIVLSACIAAKGGIQIIKDYLAWISLAVAVGTALDTWQKTGIRYKGHYVFNDKFISLYTEVELTSANDTIALSKAKEEFSKLTDHYSVAVLPT
jgi:hypothetical protein